MSYYGTLPTHTHEEEQEITWRHKLGEYLEDQKFHIGILCLTLVDAASVFIQIIYTFFHECHAPFNNIHDNTHWLIVAFEMAEVISVCICVLFILEIILSLIAFGPRYFLPGWSHWKLHVFDAAGKGLNSQEKTKAHMFMSSGYYNVCIGDCVERKRKRSSWVKKKKEKKRGKERH